MSGIDAGQQDTWKFIIDKLLSEFDNPETGYIALNKGALNYSPRLNDDQAQQITGTKVVNNQGFLSYFWSYAPSETTSVKQEQNTEGVLDSLVWGMRNFLGDTIELTVEKLNAITSFVEAVKVDRDISLEIQKLFISDDVNIPALEVEKLKKIEEIKKEEKSEISNRAIIFKNLGLVAKESIKSSLNQLNEDLKSQNKSEKTPATADEHLAVWDKMWDWIESQKDLLHICLSFESNQNVQRNNELVSRYDSLEKEVATFLFRTMFLIKLDEIKYEQSNRIKYTRMLPNVESKKLIEEFSSKIIDLNKKVCSGDGPLLRVPCLLKSVENIQEKVSSSIINTNTWYSSNLFLKDVNSDLTSIHKKSNKLSSEVNIYLTNKKIEVARQTLAAQPKIS